MFIKALIAGTAAVLISASTLAVSGGSAAADSYGTGSGYAGSGYAHPKGYPDHGYGSGGWKGRGDHGRWGHGGGYGGYGGKDRYSLHAYKPYRQVCRPVYKSVQVWNPWKGWTWQTVYAGQSCAYPPRSWSRW